MNIAALVSGAYLAGWIFPELLFLLCPHPEGFKRINVGVNLCCAFAASLIAFGLKS